MAETNDRKDYVVGVDLGGTKINAGVFNARMQCVGRARKSTKAQRGPDEVIRRIATCVAEAVDECDLEMKQVRAVGIGAPGASDPAAGKVIFAPNLPGWKDIPLQKSLEKLLAIPVSIENDCNVCTLGVHAVELKSKPRHMVGIFLGTGIGGGLILDGKLFGGFNRTAGEVGHMILEPDGPKCGCGNRGCYEAVAGRLAMARQIQAAVKDGQKTVLTDILGDDIEELRSGDLRKALKKGDKVVDKVIRSAAQYTGLAVANLINILNPEVVAIGGGVIQQLEGEMMPVITKTAFEHVMPGTAQGITIFASELGDDAGITGAAVLARTAVAA